MLPDLVLGAVLAACPGLPLADGAREPGRDGSASLEDRLAAACAAARERYRVPGLAACVLDGGEVVLARGFGLADLATERPVRADTPFRIGSITKTFTAALVLLRTERGELGLADDVARWLPELPTDGRSITLAMLLAHTSGLASYSGLDAWRATAHRPTGHAEVLALVAAEPFDFEPGTDWAYSNTGTFLAGWVLERASGASFDALVRRELAAPLGLVRTATCADDGGDTADGAEERGDGLARGYLRRDGRFVDLVPLAGSHAFASAALCSTAPELARWLRALVRGEVLAPETFARMRAPTALPDGRRIPYGLGLSLAELEGHATVEHTGEISGFRAQLTAYPDDDLVVCVLANVDSAPVERIERELAALVLGLDPRALPAPSPTATATDVAPFARYAGRYAHAQAEVAIAHGPDGLSTAGEKQGEPPRPLAHVGGDVFQRADARGTRVRFVLEDGASVALLWEADGCELLMERVP